MSLYLNKHTLHDNVAVKMSLYLNKHTLHDNVAVKMSLYLNKHTLHDNVAGNELIIPFTEFVKSVSTLNLVKSILTLNPRMDCRILP
jgi:hypothetical protein